MRKNLFQTYYWARVLCLICCLGNVAGARAWDQQPWQPQSPEMMGMPNVFHDPLAEGPLERMDRQRMSRQGYFLPDGTYVVPPPSTLYAPPARVGRAWGWQQPHCEEDQMFPPMRGGGYSYQPHSYDPHMRRANPWSSRMHHGMHRGGIHQQRRIIFGDVGYLPR
ncbi:MAG: hypothetical protein EAZ74_04370 [Alphaproteobacteria bacterium]|nr:MAG: hypothetical protein EAY76_04705 [Alphaproteobacteria bacterium]TAF14251.1 MAG: hypothetical protein EAZ74_04370 [Alphaproteobacteria bacterium]TAF38003.1 MAG: hypothetical protein EAZ66_06760 [Alphaproteobacteria bacterium]TAF76788.1 MAG: hypothetical protein EAZ52_03295 [Alphaproteobacteria bacterium]